MKIAAALGKSVAYFVDETDTPDVMVVRQDERAKVLTSKRGLDLRNVSGRYGGFAMAGAEALVEPRADSGPTPMSHPGEELVIVLEGSMVFEVDGETHEVRAGDSIHFRALRRHSWRNPGDEPARAMWLVVRAS
jgi:quercetin dioxygenase-like cupin family protein